MYFIGVDIGGTGVQAGIVNNEGEILFRKECVTRVNDGFETVMDDINNLVRDLLSENNLDIKGKSSYEVRDMLQENNLDVYYMKGTNGMLPTAFDYQPKNIKDKVMEAEKPVELIEEIIEYISKPYETLLDQYAGSGNFVIACYNKKRNGIAIEKNNEMFEKMKDNIESNLDVKFQEIDYEY